MQNNPMERHAAYYFWPAKVEVGPTAEPSNPRTAQNEWKKPVMTCQDPAGPLINSSPNQHSTTNTIKEILKMMFKNINEKKNPILLVLVEYYLLINWFHSRILEAFVETVQTSERRYIFEPSIFTPFLQRDGGNWVFGARNNGQSHVYELAHPWL